MSLEAVRSRLRSFLEGPFYPLLVVGLAFVGHSTLLEVWFGIAMLCTLMIGCWVCTDFRFAILPFLCTVLFVPAAHSPNVPSYSTYYLQKHILIPLIVVALLLLISFSVFVKRNWNRRNRLSMRGITAGILVFCIALLFNGLFSQSYTLADLAFGASFLLSLLAVYYLFSSFVRFDKATVDYCMYCLAAAGVLISLELIFAYFTSVQFLDGAPVKESVVLGWGVWTTIGGMLAFLMPAGFYFAADHKHGWVGYLLGLLSLLSVFLSQSRGALLVGCGVFALCVLTLCLVGKNKKRNRLFALGTLVAGGIFALLFGEKVFALLQNFLRYGFNDNGRFELWKIGIGHFCDYPIFGSGFYDSYVNEGWIKNVYPYLYHNTVVQLLGSAGIVGLAAYLYHRFTTLWQVLKKPSVCNVFLGISILGLIVFSLLDVLFFHTYPMIFYAVMLAVMQGNDAKEVTQKRD